MTEEKLYSTLAENYNKPDVDQLDIDEDLELTPTYPKLNKLGKEYYLTMKKEARDLILDSWTNEELNYDLFYELEQYHILDFDSSKTVYRDKYIDSEHYQGNMFWNTEAINELPIENKENLQKLLPPKENITYKEAQNLLIQDPNFLISTMTVLTNNYLNKVQELEYKLHNKFDIPDNRKFIPLLFTDEEEILFLTGNSLLKEFNKKIEDTYIEDLINDTKDVIIRFNLLLVAANTKKYNRELSWEDAFQEGLDGLFRALQDYDIDLEYRLSTYATWWIRQRIIRANTNKARPIRIPVRSDDRLYKIRNKVVKERKEDPGLTREEALNLVLGEYSEIERKNIMAAFHALNPLSLDDTIGDSDDESSSFLLSRIASDSETPEDKFTLIDKKEAVKKIFELAELSAREQRILRLRHGLEDGYPYTLDQIGKKFELTRERIRQLEKRAMRKISNIPDIEKFRL